MIIYVPFYDPVVIELFVALMYVIANINIKWEGERWGPIKTFQPRYTGRKSGHHFEQLAIHICT